MYEWKFLWLKIPEQTLSEGLQKWHTLISKDTMEIVKLIKTSECVFLPRKHCLNIVV